MRSDVSALYVRADGPYPQLVSDWWDGSPGRDARDYAGPNPVVAHPPCARWGRFWWSDGSEEPGHDAGCFAAAIGAVRRWGGVLEHPEATHAWRRFGVLRPRWGVWTRSLFRPDEWVTEVDQLAYGHRARKRTWLALVGEPMPLTWASGRPRVCVERMARRERETTPRRLAEALVSLAGDNGAQEAS